MVFGKLKMAIRLPTMPFIYRIKIHEHATDPEIQRSGFKTIICDFLKVENEAKFLIVNKGENQNSVFFNLI